MVNARNTQNENDVEILQITVPEKYADFNKEIVFTSTQAATCQTLSNWDDFVAAGWTTGY